MKVLRPILTILFTMISMSMTGCSFSLFGLGGTQNQPVYMPPGSVAEISTPARIECWITNKDTGKKEKRFIDANAGYYIGRPRVSPIGQTEIPTNKIIPDMPENQKITACPVIPK